MNGGPVQGNGEFTFLLPWKQSRFNAPCTLRNGMLVKCSTACLHRPFIQVLHSESDLRALIKIKCIYFLNSAQNTLKKKKRCNFYSTTIGVAGISGMLFLSEQRLLKISLLPSYSCHCRRTTKLCAGPWLTMFTFLRGTVPSCERLHIQLLGSNLDHLQKFYTSQCFPPCREDLEM